jgi:calcium homeostasis endoplasmic reticulum protein
MHRGRDRGNNNNNNDNRNSMRDRRSPSPQAPSFALGNTYTAKPNEFIEETNKGHQMLMKMGWAGTGTGLGTPGQQGIKEPISGGEVRDRQDKYKGVGVSLVDPYENFRKSKGAAFVTRMKARSDV